MIKPFKMIKEIPVAWNNEFINKQLLISFKLSKENIPAETFIDIHIKKTGIDFTEDLYVYNEKIEIPSCYKILLTHKWNIGNEFNSVEISINGSISTDYLEGKEIFNIYLNDINIDVIDKPSLIIDSENNEIKYTQSNKKGFVIGEHSYINNLYYVSTDKMEVLNLNVHNANIDNLNVNIINDFIKLYEKKILINRKNEDINYDGLYTNIINTSDLLFENSLEDVDDISLNDFIKDTAEIEKIMRFIYDNFTFKINNDMNIYLKYNDNINTNLLNISETNHPIISLIMKKKSINAVNVIYLLLYVSAKYNIESIKESVNNSLTEEGIL